MRYLRLILLAGVLGVAGAIIVVISAGAMTSTWRWLDDPDRWVYGEAVPFFVGIGSIVALAIIGRAWGNEIDVHRRVPLGVVAGVLSLLASVSLWTILVFQMVNAFPVRLGAAATWELWVPVIWFVGASIWWGWGLWWVARSAVEDRIVRRDPKSPGLREFAGRVAAAADTALAIDPASGNACLMWSAEGRTQEVVDHVVEDVDFETQRRRTTLISRRYQTTKQGVFDSARIPFYILVGDTYFAVDAGVDVIGRSTGGWLSISHARVADEDFAVRAQSGDILSFRTKVLYPGDEVVAYGAVSTDAEGHVILGPIPGRKRKPDSGESIGHVRVLSKMPRDRRHRRSLTAT